MRNVRRWAVGMTTAPRAEPTLEQSLTSLAQAGWNRPRLFVEPKTPVPAGLTGLPATWRDEVLGAFPNWYLGLAELVLREPRADAYLMCQDDVLFAHGLREYLERRLWPAEMVGVVSVYCPSHEHRNGRARFEEIDAGWEAWGALAYIFSNPGARTLLSDPEVVNHRHHGPGTGLKNIDSVVGRWCLRHRLPYFVHHPSLAQHIGRTSTLWARGGASGRRRAKVFTSDITELFVDQSLAGK